MESSSTHHPNERVPTKSILLCLKNFGLIIDEDEVILSSKELLWLKDPASSVILN